MADKSNLLLCAGGTGGHLFPALALAHELGDRGWTVHLATDRRAERFSADFAAERIHIIKSATIGGKNPIKLVRTAIDLGIGYWQSRALIRKLKPACVIGFGGYPTLPPILAGSAAKIPILLHEQNAVMGRANRFLAKRARAIAMGFGAMGFDTGSKTSAPNVHVLGNPVRSEVLAAARDAYQARNNSDRFNLLVFGGSQGAQFFSQILPQALGLLDGQVIANLDLVQQARREDEAELIKALADLQVRSEVAQFFSPMAERIAKADLIISRAGASTVSELAVIGRPSILVPYPYALDHDQAMNAAEMERAGGCKVITQKQLTAQRLADEIKLAIAQPEILAKMAANARKTGKPEATTDFANLVEQIVSGKQ